MDAAAFGIGEALGASGAASALTGALVGATRAWGPTAALAATYLGTMLLTQLITNNAAAVLTFPFALGAARLLGVDPRPFAMAVAPAASNGFATPVGYQTHMMVYGPGGYRFGDYVKIGIPLDILVGVVTVLLAPLVWPF